MREGRRGERGWGGMREGKREEKPPAVCSRVGWGGWGLKDIGVYEAAQGASLAF